MKQFITVVTLIGYPFVLGITIFCIFILCAAEYVRSAYQDRHPQNRSCLINDWVYVGALVFSTMLADWMENLHYRLFGKPFLAQG